MRAEVGDWLVLNSSTVDDLRTRIVGVRHGDGTPPYAIRWLDDEALLFPGPDARVVREAPTPPGCPADIEMNEVES